MPTSADFITVMAKQLPPSAAALRLLDVGGVCAATLRTLRPDIEADAVSLDPQGWPSVSNHYDAVTVYDRLLDVPFLTAVLQALRAGGRLIVVQPVGSVDEAHGRTLEDTGYVRILVEAALPSGAGVLIRGEKAHTTADTSARVDLVATRDDDHLTLDTLRGRYVHVLVRQTPNKPAWKLTADDQITWHAAAVERDRTHLLAFSSLPRAVQFMQEAVMQSLVTDINKVAKFKKAVIAALPLAVLINPTSAQITAASVVYIPLDPDAAEAPDE